MGSNPLPGTKTKRLNYLPIVITILVLLVLSVGSFFGCAKACGSIGAVIWLIVAFFLNLARRAQEP